MVVQSSLAEDLVVRDPEAAVTALRAVQDSGRAALAETGRLLRADPRRRRRAGPRPGRGLADLVGLVEELGAPGCTSRSRPTPTWPGACPPAWTLGLPDRAGGADQCAASTPRAARSSVRLRRAPTAAPVEVSNGPPTARPSERPVVTDWSVSGERVALFGGPLTHGRDPGWRLPAARRPCRSGGRRDAGSWSPTTRSWSAAGSRWCSRPAGCDVVGRGRATARGRRAWPATRSPTWC